MAQVATILHGDALATLRTLPDESVHCCITSPPYWGLRDYGTARWEGGDPACDHDQRRRERDLDSKEADYGGKARDSLAGRDTCRKCGARRVDAQIGLEQTPDAYVARMVEVFREVRRVLRNDGTLWLNLGDSYAGSWGNYGGQNRGNGTQRTRTAGSQVPNHAYDNLEDFRPPTASVSGLKPKDLVGIPWRVAFALQADGWYLRQDIIWAKPNPMPESVTDRCTKAHEYMFLLAKSATYHYDAEAVKEKSVDPDGSAARYAAPMWVGNKHESGGYSADGATHTGGMKTFDGTRNRRSVWTVATRPYRGAHFATFPPKLVEPCILAGCPEGGTVLDPFAGSGTTLAVAMEHGRNAIGIELNAEYIDLARRRLGEAKEAAGLRAVAWELSSTPLTGAKR
jgi:DNA modification methylase